MKKHTPWHRPIWLCALLAFGLHALRSFVICPLNVAVNANIIYSGSLLPVFLDGLVELIMMAIIYICYTFILETLLREGFARALPLMLIYLGSSVFGAASNLMMDIVVHGADEEIWPYLCMATAHGLGEELTQLFFVVIFSALLALRHRGTYVPTSLFSCRNRLQLSALVAAGITAFFRICNRLRYDFDLGMPVSPIEVMDMIAGYGADLLVPFLGYLGMVLLMMRHTDAVENEKP